MRAKELPLNTTAVAFGMGLGEKKKRLKKLKGYKKARVIDADMFYNSNLKSFFVENQTILTPHPKEFSSLIDILEIEKVSYKEIQKNRIKYAKIFSKAYPNIILVLKGANTLIAYQNRVYINPYGKSNLAKGGSGDVLAGVILGLLAQGYSALEAAINGSLMHTFAANRVKSSSFGLSPVEIIKEIGCL
jgi:hydroxyethylthiazole kinase-like uncharacterized protein yjeF